MIYLTSDSHFSHYNIMRYANRPFTSVKEMDDVLINNINKLVKKTDVLYHLGDWSFGNPWHFANRIDCKMIHLIRGNHDKFDKKAELPFRTISDIKTIKTEIDNQRIEIVCCHYAMRVWNKSHHGACHAWGHSHSSLPDDPYSRSMDVGVDNIAKILSSDGILRPENYRPISIVEFMEYMKKKTWKPVDHHGAITNE